MRIINNRQIGFKMYLLKVLFKSKVAAFKVVPLGLKNVPQRRIHVIAFLKLVF